MVLRKIKFREIFLKKKIREIFSLPAPREAGRLPRNGEESGGVGAELGEGYCKTFITYSAR
jgi:hypothetical protein